MGKKLVKWKRTKRNENTMELQLYKQPFQTRPPPQKTYTQWYVMSVGGGRWPCGFLLLEDACIFSQGVLAEVLDREGVKLLSSHCQQGRTAHWGWRRHSYLALLANMRTHTHTPVKWTQTLIKPGGVHVFHQTKFSYLKREGFFTLIHTGVKKEIIKWVDL